MNLDKSDSHDFERLSVAVLVPCYNEELTVAKVVSDFKDLLPGCTIYVYDNNSQDNTIREAKNAGAVVRIHKMAGKGNVVRQMFSDVESDVYVLVDGDDTYDAKAAPAMIRHLLDNRLDMVNGSRIALSKSAYRPGHKYGNKILTNFVRGIFGKQIGDMLSGYRIFSNRFIKSFPALSTGFEIETELTVHALELRMPIDEVSVDFYNRPEGSESKLRTFSDGARILKTIAILTKEERPLLFFCMLSLTLALASVLIAIPIIVEYLNTGLVPRIPTAILCTGIMILSFLSLFAGLILDTVTHGRREMKRLHYLSKPWLSKFTK